MVGLIPAFCRWGAKIMKALITPAPSHFGDANAARSSGARTYWGCHANLPRSRGVEPPCHDRDPPVSSKTGSTGPDEEPAYSLRLATPALARPHHGYSP